MPSGGYRKPSNPAPVSNPGSGRRTDGGPTQAAQYIPGGQYGEGKQLMGLQQSAPMAAQTRPTISTAQNPARQLAPITPLTAATERPNEPLTAGMPFGEGPGVESLNLNQPKASLSQTISKIIQYDSTGELSELYDYLISRGL